MPFSLFSLCSGYPTLETFMGGVQRTGAGSNPHIPRVVSKSDSNHGMATTAHRTLGLTPAGTICRSNLSLSYYPIHNPHSPYLFSIQLGVHPFLDNDHTEFRLVALSKLGEAGCDLSHLVVADRGHVSVTHTVPEQHDPGRRGVVLLKQNKNSAVGDGETDITGCLPIFEDQFKTFFKTF